MTRRGIQFPLYEGTDTGGAGGDTKDAAYYQAEAKKAFADRDDAKKKLRELEQSGAVLSAEDRKLFDELKKQQKQLEEEKLTKAGEFEKMKQQLIDGHAAETKKHTERIAQLETTLRQTSVGREFAAAAALFGKDAKTILTPEIAEAYFGRYVDVDKETGVVTVKNMNGQVILDLKTGKPAAFADAMSELIESLPNKDAVLRGSGKTGSGSSGGAGGGGNGQPTTLQNLKPSDLLDPAKREELKKQLATAGGMQIGSAFDKVPASK
jgi:hypothetical protein